MKLCLVCNFQFSDDQDLCPKDLSKLVPVGKDPLIGMLIQDRYRIESVVAKGSMGIIYKAMQEAIGRTVAVKVMHGYLVNDDESMKRYHKEAKAASRLNHPNITTIYDFGVLSSGQPYIVMDLLTGKALADILQQRGQLTLGQTLMVVNQVCQALQEAHSCGVVHRDIKPENIVIDELPNGKGIHVKVVDFGIAIFSAGEDDTIGKITKTGTVCGSPFYMSPEQCDAKKVDERGDLYSLGIVLFECLTGKVPFESKDIYQVLSMQVKDPPPRMSKMRPDLEFSDQLEKFVSKALSKDPDARFQNAREFWQALSAAVSARPAAGRSPAQESALKRQQGAAVTNQSSRNKSGEDPLSVDPEMLQRKIQQASEVLQEKTERARAESESRKRKRKLNVSSFDRVISFAQMVVPPLLALIVTVALFWVVANQTKIHALLGNKSSTNNSAAQSRQSGPKVADLIARNKLDEARAILDSRKKNGTFSSADQEDMDTICVSLARKEAKARHFKQAVAYLDQVSAEGKDDDEIKVLLKKYRKQAR